MDVRHDYCHHLSEADKTNFRHAAAGESKQQAELMRDISIDSFDYYNGVIFLKNENEVLTSDFMKVVNKLNPHQKDLLLELLKDLLRSQERVDDSNYSGD